MWFRSPDPSTRGQKGHTGEGSGHVLEGKSEEEVSTIEVKQLNVKEAFISVHLQHILHHQTELHYCLESVHVLSDAG